MNEEILNVEDAKTLIEFIFTTNYDIAPIGDGNFQTKEEAIRYVESDNYNKEEALHVTFDTAQGNYCDAIMVTHDGKYWCGEDMDMGGLFANGETIKEMLVAFRNKRPDDPYKPIELIINNQ